MARYGARLRAYSRIDRFVYPPNSGLIVSALDEIYHLLVEDLVAAEIGLRRAQGKLEEIKVLLPSNRPVLLAHIQDLAVAEVRFESAARKHRRCLDSLLQRSQKPSAQNNHSALEISRV